MPKFLDELRSKKNYFDWDEHRDIEGQILAIINWIAPDYFDRKEKGQKSNIEKLREISTPADEDWFEIAKKWEKEDKQNPADNVPKEEYVKRFKVLCDAYEIKLPNREYDIYHLCNDLSKLFTSSDEQKSTEWSEEDEDMFISVLHFLNTNYINERGKVITWVKSLPERFNLQPKQEWSEEDESKKERIISILKSELQGNKYPLLNNDGATELIDWLKSLRSQPRWKPSEEQMKELEKIIKYQLACGLHASAGLLQELIDDLRKLL